ncbi:MAG: DCC1-like thiol-disulfide oxidoreductase family protein [Planctomycetota bacterium]|jgi:predicted DCC family thiol-disulfide oxidoreductase YuxK
MKNSWTGGQYSLVRAILGAYLCWHFVALLPWGTEVFSNEGALPDGSLSPLLHAFPNVLAAYDTPWFVATLIGSGALAAICLGLGAWDRIAGVWCWYVLTCLFGRNPLIANPSLPFIGWLLLMHAFMPQAPYGSLAARGRDDPDSGWVFPPALFAAAWIVMAVGYSYSGYTKLVSPSWRDGSALRHVLENPLARDTALRTLVLSLPDVLLRVATWATLALEIAFAPLALLRRARPWIWCAMLLLHFGLLVLIDFADLTLGMVVLHLFTFDPAWVRGKRAEGTETLFFDGQCGLCHRTVRFALAEDRDDETLVFAPLQGDTFAALGEAKGTVPDSIVLRTADGQLLIRSRAVLRLAARLGGYWRLLGALFRVVPRPIADYAYDRVAAIRHRLFAKPSDLCPILPPRMRERMLP